MKEADHVGSHLLRRHMLLTGVEQRKLLKIFLGNIGRLGGIFCIFRTDMRTSKSQKRSGVDEDFVSLVDLEY